MDPSSLCSQGVMQSEAGHGNGGLNQGGSGLPLECSDIDQGRPSLGSQLQQPFVEATNQFPLQLLQQLPPRLQQLPPPLLQRVLQLLPPLQPPLQLLHHLVRLSPQLQQQLVQLQWLLCPHELQQLLQPPELQRRPQLQQELGLQPLQLRGESSFFDHSDGTSLIGSQTSKVKSKRKQKCKSSVWKSYKIITEEDGEERAQCKRCGQKYRIDSKKIGTSPLKRHVERCSRNETRDVGQLEPRDQGPEPIQEENIIEARTPAAAPVAVVTEGRAAQDTAAVSQGLGGAAAGDGRAPCGAAAAGGGAAARGAAAIRGGAEPAVVMGSMQAISEVNTGAAASSSEPESEGTPLLRHPRRLPSRTEEMARNIAYLDLEALAFGDESLESPAPKSPACVSPARVSPAPMSSRAVGTPEAVLASVVRTEEGGAGMSSNQEERTLSFEVAPGRSISRKRPREEGSSSGIAPPLAPWEPSFTLSTGERLSVEDCVHTTNSLVLEALAKGCALPKDMALYEGYSDSRLLASLLQTNLQALQKSMVVIDRYNKQSPIIAVLEAKKLELEEALGAANQRAGQLEAQGVELIAELCGARAETEAERNKVAELEAAVEKLRGDLQAEAKKVAEAETKAQAAQAKADVAFADAVKQATTHYETRVLRVRDKAWEKGWRAALRKVEIHEGHPSFAEPPPFPGPTIPRANIVIEPSVPPETEAPAPASASDPPV